MSNEKTTFQRVVKKFTETSDSQQAVTYLELSGLLNPSRSPSYHVAQRRAWEFQSKWLIAMSHAFAETLDNIEQRLERIERGKKEAV